MLANAYRKVSASFTKEINTTACTRKLGNRVPTELRSSVNYLAFHLVCFINSCCYSTLQFFTIFVNICFCFCCNNFTLKIVTILCSSFATDDDRRSIETCLEKSQTLCCLLVFYLICFYPDLLEIN